MNIKEFFNQYRKPILYWLVFGMAVLIAAGVVWWSWSENLKINNIETIEIIKTNLCGPEPPAVCAAGMRLTCEDGKWECREEKENQDTSNWKTYRSEEYGFEMKYPNEYAFEEKNINSSDQDYALLLFENTEEYRLIREGKLSGREGPTNINISIYPNLHDLTLLEWIKENRYSNFNLTDGTYLFKNLANNETIFYKWEGLYTGETLVLIKDKYVITLTVTYLNVGDKIKKDYDQILSIFRFIE